MIVVERGMSEPSAQDQKLELGRLIVAVARKDRIAFAELFAYFAPRVKAMMLRSGMLPQRAEELAQDTMLAVWNKANMFDPGTAGAAAWVFTIARNLRIDAVRRDQRAARLVQNIEVSAPEGEIPPDAAVATIQAEERVRAALSCLSQEQLKIVQLSFFDNKPHGVISEQLGVPLGTVKSRLRLAMKRLRTLLEEPQ